MELYLDLHSQPCRSVFMFAKAANIPFEYKHIDLATGQQYSEEFKKINPVCKVPAMKDGDFTLSESTAILEYMVQKYSSSVADHWYPADLQQRAQVNEYLSWQHTNIRANGSKVFLMTIMFPAVMDMDVPKEKMDAALADLGQSLQVLEDVFLKNKPFIIGDKISLADLVAIVEIMQPVGAGHDVFASRPKLVAWRDRVKKEVGEKLYDEAHDAILKASTMGEKLKSSSHFQMIKPRFRKLFS